MVLGYDSVICGKPESTSKTYFGLIDHVMCTCAFLTLVSNNSNTKSENRHDSACPAQALGKILSRLSTTLCEK